MMFKGTPTIGTKDYQRDLEIIAAQETVRDQMRAEEAKLRAAYRRGEIDDLLKPENKSPRMRELEREFNQLIDAQREILVKNEFDRIYTDAGASGMNAFTSEDMTGYFITVPANKLELWMWMECLSGVLRRTRCGLRRTPNANGIHAAGQVHRDVRVVDLGIASVPMAGRGMAFGH
jgi:predicted Zn-dependent peptidase